MVASPAALVSAVRAGAFGGSELPGAGFTVMEAFATACP